MRTIRARELTKDQTIIEDNNDRTKIERVEVTNRGNIMICSGVYGSSIKFYNPMDVVVIE